MAIELVGRFLAGCGKMVLCRMGYFHTCRHTSAYKPPTAKFETRFSHRTISNSPYSQSCGPKSAGSHKTLPDALRMPPNPKPKTVRHRNQGCKLTLQLFEHGGRGLMFHATQIHAPSFNPRPHPLTDLNPTSETPKPRLSCLGFHSPKQMKYLGSGPLPPP